MIDFLFIQLYIKKKYNKKVEDYFSIGKQSVSDWRTNNTIPPKRLLDFYNNEAQNAGIYQSDMTKYTDLLDKPAQISKINLMESQTNVFPGCVKITMNDLLSLFDGNPSKLQETVSNVFFELQKTLPKDESEKNLLKMARAVGLPYNVEMNDSNAPLIATLLLNYGYKITDTCQPLQ